MKTFMIDPGSKVRLKDFPSGPGTDEESRKEKVKEQNLKLSARLAELHELLAAERKQRVLVLLQGADTAGKDSTIRRVFSETSPSGLRVVSFKGPTQPELEHDYLWRVHAQVPGNGELVVFNRSHYEELLVVRVQGLKPPEIWKRRFEHINAFEKMLCDEGTVILKFFLHISRAEQKLRLESRLKDHTKHWKLDATDFRDRDYWEKYWEAYEDVLSRCSTEHAPWQIIPSDRKWWRDHLILKAIVEKLESLKMKYPPPPKGIRKFKIKK